MIKTTVLIPNYNGIKYIEKCLESIGGAYPVIVVDNGSCDGSAELVMRMAENNANITLIRLPENTGFCNAVNVGLEKIKTTYVFLLNNDTTIEKDTISALEKRMEADKKIFSAQSKILCMNNPETVDDCGDLYCALGWAYSYAAGKSADEVNDAKEVFSCCGAAVMYRMDLLRDEIGLFDNNHFAYLEDVDMGYRARINGYKNVFEPLSVIYHAGSATSGSKHNRFKVNLSAKNSIYLIYKNMPVLQAIINLPFFIIGFGIKTIFFCLKGMGFTYIRGLGRGFVLCVKDIKNGHRHKVQFKASNLGHYLKIQLELWANIGRKIL